MKPSCSKETFFPLDSIKHKYFSHSLAHTIYPWKGIASYDDVDVGGEVNRQAAWYYPDPSLAAARIKDCIAFWHEEKLSRVRPFFSLPA